MDGDQMGSKVENKTDILDFIWLCEQKGTQVSISSNRCEDGVRTNRLYPILVVLILPIVLYEPISSVFGFDC